MQVVVALENILVLICPRSLYNYSMTATVKLKDSDETALMQHQSILAKLLSKENIKIRHGNYTTAFFELKTRTLGLPRWANKGKDVYDLLIGHEVGHALYTPQEAIELFKKAFPNTPFDVCNIVEDIRIERLIQDTYPGLTAVFRKAYARLVTDDFFGTAKTDISKMNFLDRLNIHAKAGPSLNISFSPEELAIYDRCFKAQTFAEVLEICKDIKDLIPKNKENSKPEESKPNPQPAESKEENESQGISESQASEDSDKTPSDEGAESKMENESKDESNESPGTSGDVLDETPETPETSSDGIKPVQEASESPFISKTLESYEKALEASAQTNSNTAYFSVPSSESIRSRIIPFATLMAARANYQELPNPAEIIESVKNKHRAARKYAANLVREFDRRKAAFQYSRATVARHGVIDVNRLHAYKICDDIFSSTTKLADAKSHGMMMFVDYSGSMEENLGATLEHLVNLVLFCRAINVPFDVYGFTSAPSSSKKSTEASEINLNQLILIELFSSKMNKDEFKLALNQILAQSVVMTPGFGQRMPLDGGRGRRACRQVFSQYESLNDTPLIETVIAAHTLVAEFRKATNVQKMNVIFLTDGAGSRGVDLTFDAARSGGPDYFARPSKLTGVLNKKAITFNTYDEVNRSYAKLIKHLRETTNSTALGFFIPGSKKRAAAAAEKSISFDSSRNLTDIPSKEEGKDFFVIKGGYNFDEYYILPPAGRGGLLNDTDDESAYEDFIPAEDLTKNKRELTKRFLGLNLKKKSSQVILNKFAQMIA